MAHFGLLAGFTLHLPTSWRVGDPFKTVDQTRKLQPNVNNNSDVCFCLFKNGVLD